MKTSGLVTPTKNPKWLRITPTEVGEFANAMVEAGELQPGDQVTIEITKNGSSK